MYLRRLHVRNLKRLRDFRLDFTSADGKPRKWTVLIGENGTAKSTVLQAIALAATGSKQVNTLAGPVVRHLRDRRSAEPLAIDAMFEFTERWWATPAVQVALPPSGARDRRLGLHSEVTLQPGSTSLAAWARYDDLEPRGLRGIAGRREDPLDAARDVHLPLWFVAGYGIARLLPDPVGSPSLDRPSIERLAPLLDPRAALVSTSFANHFARKDLEAGRPSGTTSRLYGRILNQAIKLGGQDLLPDIDRLELRGQKGVGDAAALLETDRFHQRMGAHSTKIPGVALSQGYQATLAWIADLVGHVLLEADFRTDTTEMEGLVLLDELDLYLHPTWQSTIVTALRRVFPRIQFIVTTHSPVVLAGVRPDEVVLLMTDEATGDVVRGCWDDRGRLVPANGRPPRQPDPRPMTGSELYRTWFGIDRLTPNPLGHDLRDYLVLRGDPSLSKADARKRDALAQKLEHADMLKPREEPEAE